MSTLSLPSYIVHTLGRAPSYTAEPHADEQRLAHNLSLRSRRSSEFVKHSKGGNVHLHLSQQTEGTSLPEYGRADLVEGTVEFTKPENVVAVEVKIEGALRLDEVGEGGGTTHQLCLLTAPLYRESMGQCPVTIPFSLSLPETFRDDGGEYPLPPTHKSHLSGIPGFVASIVYSVSVVVTKENKLSLLSGHHPHTTVSTPFIYAPRSRPAKPLPTVFVMQHAPGSASPGNVPDWECFQSILKGKIVGGQDIVTHLYLPTPRVFCMKHPIPFNLTHSSSAFSLAAYMPLAPATNATYGVEKRATTVQLVRQTIVDVRNTVVLGTKTDIWRTQVIGEGVFRRTGEGADRISYSGEITVAPEVEIASFKAGGFSVKDFVVLTVTPSDPAKAPFGGLRQVVPVRLTTDPWDMGTEPYAPIAPEDMYQGLEY